MLETIVARHILIGLSLVSFALAACSQPAPALTVGDLKDFATVCDTANEGHRVALVGYLRLPNSFKEGAQDVVLDLYQKAEANVLPVGVRTNFGTDANHVEPVSKKQYADTDLEVHLSDGRPADYQTKVKVSGNVYVPALAPGGTCALDNPLIELAQ